MSYRNYLNISTAEKDFSIYRVMPIQRLIEMFLNKQNVLSKPKLWDDPFENFILQSRARLSDGNLVSFGMRDSLYGQCWTLQRESDAMWRIYSQDKNGVKIRTTIRKLYESIYSVIPSPKRDVACFIGKVIYHTQQAIQRRLNTPLSLESSGACIAETLLVKRKAFSHEKEIRLIYWADDPEAAPELFRYTIDPNLLIDQIVFDPRLDQRLYAVFKEYFLSLNFNGRIIQSGLYRAPANTFIRLN